MLKLDATPDEINAHNASVYKELYHNRGRHLLFLYTFIFSTFAGALFE